VLMFVTALVHNATRATMRSEIARGFLVLGVLHVHLLQQLENPGVLGLAQLKLLAPQVSAFFFLSGMSAPLLGARTLGSVLRQSLMLLILARVSHIGGFLLTAFLYDGFDASASMTALIKPLVYGTGESTYVAWFFTVLAVARLSAWLFERHKIWFIIITIVMALGLTLAANFAAPGNLYEWRNWPTAIFFFLVGMKMSKSWVVTPTQGLLGLAGALLLTWFNKPDFWSAPPCLKCSLQFVAAPVVGQYGSLSVYIAGELCFVLFLLWVSQARSPAWLLQPIQSIGRYSLALLLLHGWIIAAGFPALTALWANSASPALFFIALFLIIPALHVILFFGLRGVLDNVIGACFALAHWAVSFARPAMATGRAYWSRAKLGP
jgi:hypothetical protein